MSLKSQLNNPFRKKALIKFREIARSKGLMVERKNVLPEEKGCFFFKTTSQWISRDYLRFDSFCEDTGRFNYSGRINGEKIVGSFKVE